MDLYLARDEMSTEANTDIINFRVRRRRNLQALGVDNGGTVGLGMALGP